MSLILGQHALKYEALMIYADLPEKKTQTIASLLGTLAVQQQARCIHEPCKLQHQRTD